MSPWRFSTAQTTIEPFTHCCFSTIMLCYPLLHLLPHFSSMLFATMFCFHAFYYYALPPCSTIVYHSPMSMQSGIEFINIILPTAISIHIGVIHCSGIIQPMTVLSSPQWHYPPTIEFAFAYPWSHQSHAINLGTISRMSRHAHNRVNYQLKCSHA